MEDLHFTWYNRIVLLITEYFYNDRERMKAVFGAEFVQSIEYPESADSGMVDFADDNAKFKILIPKLSYLS